MVKNFFMLIIGHFNFINIGLCQELNFTIKNYYIQLNFIIKSVIEEFPLKVTDKKISNFQMSISHPSII